METCLQRFTTSNKVTYIIKYHATFIEEPFHRKVKIMHSHKFSLTTKIYTSPTHPSFASNPPASSLTNSFAFLHAYTHPLKQAFQLLKCKSLLDNRVSERK